MLPWEKGKTWFLNPLQNLKVRVHFHTQIMCIFRLMCACYFKAVMCCKIFLNVLINAFMGGFRKVVIQH